MMSDSKQIQSPCIKHCCLNDHDICLGCFRSLDEILIWSQVSDEKKQEILSQCQQRKQKS